MADEEDRNTIIYPLPGDKTGGAVPVKSWKTGPDGKGTFKVRFTRVGRYQTQLSSGEIKSNIVYTQVVPRCGTKADIRMGNSEIRARLRSATDIDEIHKMVEESRLCYQLAQGKLKKLALKELEDTNKNADNRIEQLRLRETKWSLDANASPSGDVGIGLNKTTKKSSISEL
jgi:hypothetical protein